MIDISKNFISTIYLYHIGIQIILFVCIAIAAYLIFEFHSKSKQHRKLKKFRNLDFELYKKIAENADDYIFSAPYGIENVLHMFTIEVPHLIRSIDSFIMKHRDLIGTSNNDNDNDLMNAFLNIESQLTTIVATSGINTAKRYTYYCDNFSKLLKLKSNNKIIRDYVIIADKLYDQFKKLNEDDLKSSEIYKNSNAMYMQFFEFFERINKIIYVTEVQNKKEETKHE